MVATQLLVPAKELLAQLRSDAGAMVAPVLLQAEFVSSVRKLERRGQLSRDTAEYALRDFHALPIRYYWDDDWVPRALEIARSIGASRIYDSIYLACAESYGFVLYTCDASFVRAFRTPPPVLQLVAGGT